MEVEVAGHGNHVLLLLVHEGRSLTGGDAAKADDGTCCSQRVCGQKCNFSSGTHRPHAKAAAGRNAEFQLVERPELHLRIREHHFDVGARDVLEQLQVDAIVFDRLGQMRPHLFDPALGVGPRNLIPVHEVADASLNRLQFEQHEQALENRHFDFGFAA